MLGGIITICGGVLASSSYIISKKPNAKQFIDKLAPYQSWIGVVLFVWGILEVLAVISTLGLISADFLGWLFRFLAGLADLSVGFILGFGLISKDVLSKNEAVQKKGEELNVKLSKFQIILGEFAIIMGVLYILTFSIL